MSSGLDVAWLGRRDYDETTLLQEELVEKRRAGQIGDLLLMLEHPPTYTCGRRTLPGDLPQSREWYREQGFAVSDTPRGGQVTYHGPGQLVIYPIVDLRGIGEQPEGSERVDVAGFVDLLEEAMISAAGQFMEVGPRKIEGMTGIWAGDAKIGSIGLRISRGISSHGLSLNVSCDLEPFKLVTACGIEDGRATSILEIAGSAPDVREAGNAVASALAAALDRPLTEIEPEERGIAPAGVPTP